MEKIKKTNDAKKGGLFVGKSHDEGGIPAIVVDTGQPIEVEGGEAIINKKATAKHWKELSKINQSTGGVPIPAPDRADELLDKFEKGGKLTILEKKTIHSKWKRLVNMTYSQLKKYYDSKDGKSSGLTQKEANDLGIDSGRESAVWIMKMKRTNYKDWTPEMWRWAKKQISFISRMRGNKGELMENGKRTPKLKSLLIWGHNPYKFEGGGDIPKESKFPVDANSLQVMLKYASKDEVEEIQEALDAQKKEYKEKYKKKKQERYAKGGKMPEKASDIAFAIIGAKTLLKYADESEKSDIELYIKGLEILDKMSPDETPAKKENLVFKDKKYDITYSVEQRPDGRWTVYAESPNFKKNDQYAPSGLASKEDAIDLAKLSAGITKEEDPEKVFLANEYAKGGSLESRILLAPNGKPSNLTPEQYQIVRTPEFKAWFGDWEKDSQNASKVVDENGEPLVCYHSSNKRFNTFDYNLSYDGAIWFTESLQKLYDGEAGASGSGIIYSVFLNIKKMGNWDDYDEGIPYLLNKNFNGAKLDDDYIVFEPEQIKLADGSNTTFDSENPDIRFETGGNVNSFNFTSYDDAQIWIKEKSKEYSNQNQFYASNEYKLAYPIIKKLYEIEKGSYVQKSKVAMQESSVDFGDRVFYDHITPFLNSEKYSGVIVERKGLPYVKLDAGQQTISGAKSIRWHKGWKKQPLNFKDGGSVELPILLAPNGKPSNLTPEQYQLVRTPEFKAWFGDWENLYLTKVNDSGIDEVSLKKIQDTVSKVVDENGEPIVVYHGTFAKEIKVFDESQIGYNSGNEGHYGFGFYFSYDIEEAKTYTSNESPNILHCFLNVKNPFYANKLNHLELYSKDFGYPENKEPVAIDSEWMENSLKNFNVNAYNLYKSIKNSGFDTQLGWKLFLNKYPDAINDSFDLNLVTDWIEYDGSQEIFSKNNEPENFNSAIPDYILESISDKLNIPISEIKTINHYTIGNYPNLLYMMDLGNNSRYLTDRIKEDGFDGIIAGSELIAFKSNQIKLADGSNTTFDGNNPDIRFKRGGVSEGLTYKEKYNKKYGYSLNESHSLEEISKDTGVSIKGLQEIYNKGVGAYRTNPESVRPNVKSPEQWAMARVYSAVMGGKTARIDAKELKMEKGGQIDQNVSFIQVEKISKYLNNITKSRISNGLEIAIYNKWSDNQYIKLYYSGFDKYIIKEYFIGSGSEIKIDWKNIISKIDENLSDLKNEIKYTKWDTGSIKYTSNYKSTIESKIYALSKLKEAILNSIYMEIMADGGKLDEKDKVTIDVPLLIRILELSREDIKSDAELHQMVERILDLKNKGTLTMEDYDFISKLEQKVRSKYAKGGSVQNNMIVIESPIEMLDEINFNAQFKN